MYRDLADVAPRHRNLVWLYFTDPAIRDLIVGWEPRGRRLLAQLRGIAGRHHDDPRLIELVKDLNEHSLEFRT